MAARLTLPSECGRRRIFSAARALRGLVDAVAAASRTARARCHRWGESFLRGRWQGDRVEPLDQPLVLFRLHTRPTRDAQNAADGRSPVVGPKCRFDRAKAQLVQMSS
jgi:hypothetical protein